MSTFASQGSRFAAIIARAEATVRGLIGPDAKNTAVARAIGLSSESTFRGLRDLGRSPNFETVSAICSTAPIEAVIDIVQSLVGERLTIGLPPASQRPVDGRPEGVRDHAFEVVRAAQAAQERIHDALRNGHTIDGDVAAALAADARKVANCADDLQRAARLCAARAA
jgi:hypothetical protein